MAFWCAVKVRIGCPSLLLHSGRSSRKVLWLGGLGTAQLQPHSPDGFLSSRKQYIVTVNFCSQENQKEIVHIFPQSGTFPIVVTDRMLANFLWASSVQKSCQIIFSVFALKRLNSFISLGIRKGVRKQFIQNYHYSRQIYPWVFTHKNRKKHPIDFWKNSLHPQWAKPNMLMSECRTMLLGIEKKKTAE